MKTRILVVDDDSSILELVRILLEGEGYQVQTCDSGQTALKTALSHPPDAAIIDLMMPGMNGLDLIQALRYNPRTHHLPVLICSAYYGDLRHVTAELRQKNTSCLRKPFQIQELLDLVAHMVATRKRRRRKAAQEQCTDAPTPVASAPGSWAPLIPVEPGGSSGRNKTREKKAPGTSGVSPLPPAPPLATSEREDRLDSAGQSGSGIA
ncbi:MAG: response regulator [Sphingomonadaceae bacterium]